MEHDNNDSEANNRHTENSTKNEVPTQRYQVTRLSDEEELITEYANLLDLRLRGQLDEVTFKLALLNLDNKYPQKKGFANTECPMWLAIIVLGLIIGIVCTSIAYVRDQI